MKKRLVKPTSQHQTEKVSLYIFELTVDCLEPSCGGGGTDTDCGSGSGDPNNNPCFLP